MFPDFSKFTIPNKITANDCGFKKESTLSKEEITQEK